MAAGASLTRVQLDAARALQFRQHPDLALRSQADAVRFIEEMGLVLLFRSGSLVLPNLADACVGGHWEWGRDPTGLSAWELKETIPAAGATFYARLLGGRGTFVSWSLVPALIQVWRPAQRAHALDTVARLALDVITLAGPILTRDLRREVQGMVPCEGREVRAAIAELQRRLLITVAGGSLEGWSMHAWDLLSRRMPEPNRSAMSASEARRRLVQAVITASLAAKPGPMARLFGWRVETARQALAELESAGTVATDVPIEGLPGRFAVAPSLMAAAPPT